PERTVATGEAAPGATQPHPAPTPPSGAPVEPQPATTVPDAAEPEPGITGELPAPTQPVGAPAPPRTGRTRPSRRLRAGLVVAAVAAVGALGFAVLGGGSDSGGGGASGDGGGRGGSGGGTGSGGGAGSGVPGIKFQLFDEASAFTVEVPVGLAPLVIEDQLKTTKRTELQSGEINVQIVQEDDTPPAERLDTAATERSAELGYAFIARDPRTIGDRQTELFAYETEEEELGPATVFNYAFNDGGSGWRTRAAVAGVGANSRKLADEVAAHMAETLRPR
ncbi:MAG TPA: hypothetical protein VLA62_01500, partial [Solirubrobacterales bacterium]|nr:hypothetical protein [Solirubrobacterales bacterium]